MAKISGGCLCGAVQYESNSDPMGGGHCYCDDCRKSSGTGHCSHMITPKESFRITGELNSFDKPADSGNMVTRFFCPTCGGPVYSLNSAMTDFVFIRASTLDDMELFQPGLMVYTSRAPSWDRPPEGLQGFPEMAPPGGRSNSATGHGR